MGGLAVKRAALLEGFNASAGSRASGGDLVQGGFGLSSGGGLEPPTRRLRDRPKTAAGKIRRAAIGRATGSGIHADVRSRVFPMR